MGRRSRSPWRDHRDLDDLRSRGSRAGGFLNASCPECCSVDCLGVDDGRRTAAWLSPRAGASGWAQFRHLAAHPHPAHQLIALSPLRPPASLLWYFAIGTSDGSRSCRMTSRCARPTSRISIGSMRGSRRTSIRPRACRLLSTRYHSTDAAHGLYGKGSACMTSGSHWICVLTSSSLASGFSAASSSA